MSAVDVSPSPGPSLASTDVQMQQVKRLLDTIHIQFHESWLGMLLMDSDDFSNSDSSNLNALEFSGKAVKGTPCSSIHPKYFCPVKYSTTNGFACDASSYVLLYIDYVNVFLIFLRMLVSLYSSKQESLRYLFSDTRLTLTINCSRDNILISSLAYAL